VERALIMAPGDQIDAADLHDLVPAPPSSRETAVVAHPTTLAAPGEQEGADAASDPSDSGTDAISATDTSDAGPDARISTTPRPTTLREFKEQAEREFLVEKLREHHWNISRTAEVIGTPRSNLYKKLEQYSITQEQDG
jgi:two-component system nitrogen regulation response regulator NtrX